MAAGQKTAGLIFQPSFLGGVLGSLGEWDVEGVGLVADALMDCEATCVMRASLTFDDDDQKE